MKKWLLMGLLALSGCTARSTLVQRLAAVDDGGGAPAPGGRVRYLVSSARWVMEAERADAHRKMFEHCQGAYDVQQEWDSNDAVVHGLFWSQMYVHHYVEFRCPPADETVRKVMSGVEPLVFAPAQQPPVPEPLAQWQPDWGARKKRASK